MAQGDRRHDRERLERAKLDATPPWQTKARSDGPPTAGPYDEKDAPDDGLARIDLGAMFVPVGDGQDVRLELNENKELIGITVAGRDGTMQLGVFAAPRNEGIWDEVRAEIASSLNSQKGQAKEHLDGPFGTELTGKVPGEDGQLVPVRFIGVDGPRWFLRAMLIGPAATDATRAKVFEETFRNIIVSRGTEPLPVREPVPLRLPKDVELPDSGETAE